MVENMQESNWVLKKDLISVLIEDYHYSQKEVDLLFSGIDVFKPNGIELVNYPDFIANMSYRFSNTSQDKIDDKYNLENFRKYLEERKTNGAKKTNQDDKKDEDPKRKQLHFDEEKMAQKFKNIRSICVTPLKIEFIWIEDVIKLLNETYEKTEIKRVLTELKVEKKYDKKRKQVRFAVSEIKLQEKLNELGYSQELKFNKKSMVSKLKPTIIEEIDCLKELYFNPQNISWKDLDAIAEFLEQNDKNENRSVIKLLKKIYKKANELNGKLPKIMVTKDNKDRSIESLVECYYRLNEQGDAKILESPFLQEMAILVNDYENLRQAIRLKVDRKFEIPISKIIQYKKPKKLLVGDDEYSYSLKDSYVGSKFYEVCKVFAENPLTGIQLMQWKHTNQKYLNKFKKARYNYENQWALQIAININKNLEEALALNRNLENTDENYLDFAKNNSNKEDYEKIRKCIHDAKKNARYYIQDKELNKGSINEEESFSKKINKLAVTAALCSLAITIIGTKGFVSNYNQSKIVAAHDNVLERVIKK